MSDDKPNGQQVSRREFIGQSVAAAATVAGFMIVKPEQVRGSEANSAIRVGLLGCGDRGTADTEFLLNAGPTRLVALADLFQDKLDKARAHFDDIAKSKGQSRVNKRQMFRGPEAFQEMANSKEVDAVVLTTPPFFHPQHLDALVTAGKHVYCEKPVAVDMYGINRVLDCGRRAEGRLSLEVGFQLRNAPPYVAQRQQILAGALGTIASGEGYYFSGYLKKPDWPGVSADERMMRNWVHYRILSGDIIVEQNIHVIDQFNWLLGAHPVRATAACGRRFRPDHGNASINYNVVFYYPQGINVTFSSTQFDKGWGDVAWRLFGSKGVSEAHYNGPVAIYGDQPWNWQTAAGAQAGGAKVSQNNLKEADPDKKKSFVDSILSGKFHNQVQEGVDSAVSTMIARQAAYTAEDVTWEGFTSSDERWELPFDLNQFA